LKALVKVERDLLDGEHCGPGCCELERERQAVEPAIYLCYRNSIGVGACEVSVIALVRSTNSCTA
jgi:hypothetical protein